MHLNVVQTPSTVYAACKPKRAGRVSKQRPALADHGNTVLSAWHSFVAAASLDNERGSCRHSHLSSKGSCEKIRNHSSEGRASSCWFLERLIRRSSLPSIFYQSIPSPARKRCSQGTLQSACFARGSCASLALPRLPWVSPMR